MRFGTTGAPPFHRADRALLRITLRAPSPGNQPTGASAVASACRHLARPRATINALPFPGRLTSFNGRTRLHTLIKLLLPPRSAPRHPPDAPARILPRPPRAGLPRPATAASPPRSAPSIFCIPWFGGYVATRFLADANLHGHRPAVPTSTTHSLPVLARAAQPHARFIPLRAPCLPLRAH